jgi:hypothetical protein
MGRKILSSLIFIFLFSSCSGGGNGKNKDMNLALNQSDETSEVTISKIENPDNTQIINDEISSVDLVHISSTHDSKNDSKEIINDQDLEIETNKNNLNNEQIDPHLIYLMNQIAQNHQMGSDQALEIVYELLKEKKDFNYQIEEFENISLSSSSQLFLRYINKNKQHSVIIIEQQALSNLSENSQLVNDNNFELEKFQFRGFESLLPNLKTKELVLKIVNLEQKQIEKIISLPIYDKVTTLRYSYDKKTADEFLIITTGSPKEIFIANLTSKEVKKLPYVSSINNLSQQEVLFNYPQLCLSFKNNNSIIYYDDETSTLEVIDDINIENSNGFKKIYCQENSIISINQDDEIYSYNIIESTNKKITSSTNNEDQSMKCLAPRFYERNNAFYFGCKIEKKGKYSYHYFELNFLNQNIQSVAKIPKSETPNFKFQVQFDSITDFNGNFHLLYFRSSKDSPWQEIQVPNIFKKFLTFTFIDQQIDQHQNNMVWIQSPHRIYQKALTLNTEKIFNVPSNPKNVLVTSDKIIYLDSLHNIFASDITLPSNSFKTFRLKDSSESEGNFYHLKNRSLEIEKSFLAHLENENFIFLSKEKFHSNAKIQMIKLQGFQIEEIEFQDFVSDDIINLKVFEKNIYILHENKKQLTLSIFDSSLNLNSQITFEDFFQNKKIDLNIFQEILILQNSSTQIGYNHLGQRLWQRNLTRSRHHNLHLLDKEKVITISGNHLATLNIKEGTIQEIFNLDSNSHGDIVSSKVVDRNFYYVQSKQRNKINKIKLPLRLFYNIN